MSEPDAAEPPMSKSAQKKAAKAAAKAKLKAEKAAKHAASQAANTKSDDEFKHLFGHAPVMQSRAEDRKGAEYVSLRKLNVEEYENKVVNVLARVQSVREQGAGCFVVLREVGQTAQALVWKSESVPKNMVKFAGKISPESVVRVEATVVKADVKGCDITDVELRVSKLFVVSAAERPLPFQISDASASTADFEAQDKTFEEESAKLNELQAKADKDDAEAQKEVAKQQKVVDGVKTLVRVDQSTRLDHRTMDLRTPANNAIMRLQSAVCFLFRDFLLSQDFVEIHTPKILGTASESGANVFKLGYFGREAYLAQSPQLYKQMGVLSDLMRVFEVAPVFRAENSNTPRHMTEFIGLDVEMAFNEHYHEVLDMLDRLFEHIFNGLDTKFKHLVNIVSQQYPVQPFVGKFPSPRIPFKEAVAMLNIAGHDAKANEDLSTTHEKALGALVKEKFGTDFYQLDKFPASARPFYTMLDPVDKEYTNSYDLMMRGQEICSGAQRVHDIEMLRARCAEHHIKMEEVGGYIDAFKYGAFPHAGGGIGLERVLFLYLGLNSIKKASMFPRDPARLYP